MVQRSTLEMASRWDSSVASSESSTTSSKDSDSDSRAKQRPDQRQPNKVVYTRRLTALPCAASKLAEATWFLNRLAFPSDLNQTSHCICST